MENRSMILIETYSFRSWQWSEDVVSFAAAAAAAAAATVCYLRLFF